MVRCIMLAIMNNEFSHRFENAQPQDMLQILNESFGISDDVERYKTSCAIFNARMREEASVTDHVLYMIEMIERLGKLGFPLHEQLGKDAILNFLPPSYLDFLSHYRMMKPAVNYHYLLGLLQTFEKDHQLQKKSVNLMGGSGVGRHPLKKGMKKKGKKKVQHVGPSQTEKKRANKNKVECFYCKKLGH